MTTPLPFLNRVIPSPEQMAAIKRIREQNEITRKTLEMCQQVRAIREVLEARRQSQEAEQPPPTPVLQFTDTERLIARSRPLTNEERRVIEKMKEIDGTSLWYSPKRS